MTVYQIRFEPVEETSVADLTVRACDDAGARKIAFSAIRKHLAQQLRANGQIDLRGTARILGGDGIEISTIDFAHAVGVVR